MRSVGLFLLGCSLGANAALLYLGLLPFVVFCLIFIGAIVVSLPIYFAVVYIVDCVDDARMARIDRARRRADRRADALARIKSEVGSR